MIEEINYYKLKDTDGREYILSSILQAIYLLLKFMTQVIEGKETFYTTYIKYNNQEGRTVSSLGKHLRKLPYYMRVFSPDYKFSPLLMFFFEEYRKHSICGYPHPTHGHDEESVKQFDDFVATMRKNAKATNLKKRVADWESKSKKNSKRLDQFESLLFERHSRLVAVRLDVHYHKAIFTPEELHQLYVDTEHQNSLDQWNFMTGLPKSMPRLIQGRVSLEEVQKDRERLFAKIKGKPSIFEHLIGYVWNIEWGREAGYHLHLMFFFNGANLKKHEYLAEQIGEYIKNDITNGRCYYENCNLSRKKYGDRWALGEIHNSEAAKRENLRYAMQYFCKTSQMAQVVPYKGCRLFGSGFVHRQRKGKGGRPRTRTAVDTNNQRRL